MSGYICPSECGRRVEGATLTWVEIHATIQGWIVLATMDNIWTRDNHIKLSVGRNFYDCTLVKGTFKGFARQTLSVCISIGYEDGRQFEEINNVKLHDIKV